jgi:glycosyltransferase involved in cell wall biosynthesis
MPSGESTNTLFLANHLAASGIDVHVLTGKGNTYPSGTRSTVHPVMPDWSWRSFPKFISFLRDCSPDAVLLMYVGWMYGHHPMITFAPSFAKKLFPGIRFITRVEHAYRAFLPERVSLLTRAIRKAVIWFVTGRPVAYFYGTLLRDSDKVIVLCSDHRRYLLTQDATIEKKLELIPPPPNMHIIPDPHSKHRTRMRAALQIQEDERLIIYLGYIYPGKNFDVLLRAFRLILDSRQNVRLLVLGSGLKIPLAGPLSYEDEMRQLSKNLDIDDRIIWMGSYQSTDEKASAYLRSADVCVLLFGSGLQMNNSSFACAAAHGLPVISTQGKFSDQCLVHGQNVYFCPPNDPAALAAAIDRVLGDPDLRDRLRSGAHRLADEWFSWPRAIRSTLGTFGVSLDLPSPPVGGSYSLDSLGMSSRNP